jgi:hypothetical protein
MLWNGKIPRLCLRFRYFHLSASSFLFIYASLFCFLFRIHSIAFVKLHMAFILPCDFPNCSAQTPPWTWSSQNVLQTPIFGPLNGLFQIKARYGSNAWREWSSFFLRQLCDAIRRGDRLGQLCLKFLLDSGYGYFLLHKGIATAYDYLRDLQSTHEHRVETEFKKQFPFWHHPFEAGSWTNHHGLRNCTEDVRDYLIDKWMIDVGAEFGDSLMMLRNYSRKGVVSYEINEVAAKGAEKCAKQLGEEKHIIVHCGLAERTRSLGGSRVVAFDDEVERLKLEKVGFMKVDIEGDELGVLKGSIKTLRTQHPILSISVYHNIEMMDLPKWIEDEVGGYDLHWENLGISMSNVYELTMMAYPKNLQFLPKEKDG